MESWLHKIQDVILYPGGQKDPLILDKHSTIDENGVPVFFYRKYLSEPIRVDGKPVIVYRKIFNDDYHRKSC